MAIHKMEGEKKYQVDVYDGHRRIRKVVHGTRYDADQVHSRMIQEREYRKYHLPNYRSMPFKDLGHMYIKEYSIPRKKSSANDISKLKSLVRFFGDTPITQVTVERIERFRSDRLNQPRKWGGGTVSGTTVNRELALLSSIMTFAIQRGMLERNPVSRVKKSREEPKQVVLCEADMNLLIKQAEPPLQDMIIMGLNTGMRRGEILNLEWKNVLLEERLIIVQRTKNNKIRRVPMNDMVHGLLSRLKLKQGGRSHVFENPRTGKPFGQFDHSWRTLRNKLGFNELRFHDLRHCFATHALSRGGDIHSLQTVLGHASITMTARYLSGMTESQKKLVDGLNIGNLKERVG